jgi:hypothetical protein
MRVSLGPADAGGGGDAGVLVDLGAILDHGHLPALSGKRVAPARMPRRARSQGSLAWREPDGPPLPITFRAHGREGGSWAVCRLTSL